MSDFVEQLRLAEKAAEDIYFAKINRELIESLHRRMQAEKDACRPSDQAGACTNDNQTAGKAGARGE
jgi:tRNA A58 N-methylase Trm61